jgi:hypothetical protein
VAIDHDDPPLPRIELERLRLDRMPDGSYERARVAREFRYALLSRLMLRDLGDRS